MIEAINSGVKLTLWYERGNFSFSHLSPSAADAALYEVADAMNSVQREPAKKISKTAARRIIER